MLADKKSNTNIGIGIGFALNIAARFLMSNENTVWIGLLLGLLGTVCFIWGCMNYAEGKGHSKWLGLLGLLSCLGLLILVLLPDRHKQS